MKEAEKKALIAIPLIILIGVGVALAGSQGSAKVAGLPLYGLGVAFAFVLNWLVFVFAYIGQTEKFFDLTGSLTYISVTVLAVLLSPVRDARSLLLMALVLIWAGRLGSFLFMRIRKAGKDDRFDEIKISFVRFLNVWTIQGLWVTFTLAAALVAITSSTRKPLGIFAIVGFVVWIIGFSFEAVADAQKTRFKADPNNKGKFIHTGLWSRSRHPNYFGEITLWLGVAIIALPVLSGWQWVAMISPVFVFILLTRVSGVPMLEKKADSKWGGQEDYEEYKKNTPVLFPKL
jgi:steroid 5-alpha reductase family enzyme